MKRALAAVGLLAISAFASANGAMPYALQMFEFRTWIIYVVAMLAVEAWMIGRWIGMSWKSSIGMAIAGNAFTAFCCPWIIAPVLHYPFVGTLKNPNPFLNAVALLTSFAFVSAFFESLFWIGPAHQHRKKWVMWRTLLAHLAGVPIALVILLIPSRPYVGLERFTDSHRRWDRSIFSQRVADDLNSGAKITDTSAEAFMLHYEPLLPTFVNKTDWWTTAYAADYQRFDTHEMKRRPFEINAALIGKTAKDIKSDTWLMRVPYEDGTCYGYVIRVDKQDGYISVNSTYESKRLGY